MIKMVLKKLREDEAVSEIIGTILMLAIAVIIFSSLIVYVFSSANPSASPPDVNMVGYMGESYNSVVEHRGGDSIPIDNLKVIIWKGEEESMAFEGTSLQSIFHDTNDNSRWDVGDYISINCTSIFGSVTHWQISVAIIDKPSNSIIMSGILQQGILRTSPPVAMFTYNPWDPKTLEIMVFNASQSYDPDGGSIVTYKWDFNSDGTTDAYGMVVVHKYSTSGTYNVTLTVVDDEGQIGTASTSSSGVNVPPPVNVTDNQPPIVNFSWSVDPDIDGTISFVADVTDPDGNAENAFYSWNFGDGNSSSSKNPSHTYGRSGTYTVTLIVTDEDGGTSSYETTVTVPNILPIAGFSIDRANITTASSVTFDGGSPFSYDKDGEIVNWTWDFENDSVIDAYGSTVSHLFSVPGNYTVVLNVTDNEGGWTVYRKNITVYTPAEASPPRFLFVDNTPVPDLAPGPWAGGSGINNILAACQEIMPSGEYSWGKAIDQWTFVNDSAIGHGPPYYTSPDMWGKNISDTVLNEFDIVIWSTGDFPGDGGHANWDGNANTWNTPLTEGYDDTSDHVYEIAQHLTGNVTAGTFLITGTYAARDLQNYPGNYINSDEEWLGNVLGLQEPTGGIHYDSDTVPYSGRVPGGGGSGYTYFSGKPYHVSGTLVGVANTSSGQLGIATLNITSPIDMYSLNKQSDSTFVYSLQPGGEQTQVTLLNEDMETDPGWSTGGSGNEWDWGICKGGPGYANAHSGSKCYGTDMSGSDYRYNNNANCYVRTGYIDLTSASSATLEFYDWYKIENGWDYVYLQVYDGSWHTIASFTGNQQSWTHKSYDISSYVGSNIRIRWLLQSDVNTRYDGYYLDDVWVNATQQGIPSGYYAIDAVRGTNRSIILGFDLNADEITPESRTNYLRNVLAWLAEGAGYTTEVWVNNDPPEGWLDNESHVDTIQAGINAVPPGGTVYVIGTDNQVYEENVVVDKSIDLIGIDNPTIRASGTNVVTVQVDWAKIDGFNIEGDSAENGIYIEDATRCTIINCTISTNISKMDIYLSSSHNNTIRNNTLRGGLYGIYADHSLGNTILYNDINSNDGGIYLYQTSLTTIRDNIIHNNGNFGGIYMESGRQNVIIRNTIENNSGEGIHLISSTNKNEIEYNIIRNNSNGILLEISNSNILLNNTISNNSNDGVVCTDFSHSNTLRENNIIFNGRYGINLQNSSNNAILYNDVESNGFGMYIVSSGSNVFQTNTISDNDNEGISMISSSDNNIIYSCTLRNNSHGILIQSSRNNTIEENTINSNNADGICLYYSLSGLSGENRIVNNTVTSNNGSGVYSYSSRGNNISGNSIYSNSGEGIKLLSSSDENVIGNNNLWNNSYGLYIDRSNFNEIFGNIINNSIADGVYVTNYASENKIYENNISYNQNGIEFYSSNTNNISNNTIWHNYLNGLLLTHSSNNNVNENKIYSNTGDGIRMSSSDSNTITQNTIYSNNFNGIHLLLSGGTGNNIINNTIHSNTNHGIYLENSRAATAGNNQINENAIYSNGGNGIYLLSSNINSLQDNTIYANTLDGIYLNSSDSNTVAGNEIYGNTGNGLSFYISGSNDIQSNNISFNLENGISIFQSSQGDSFPLQDNLIWNNSGAGVYINSSSSNYFIHNIIWNNSCGVNMTQSSTSNEIRENNITENGCGVFVATSDCSNNRFYNNNFINNTPYLSRQAYDIGGNDWDGGYASGGNYWSDYGGNDTTGPGGTPDGIGDTPYTIAPSSVGNVDQFPLITPKSW